MKYTLQTIVLAVLVFSAFSCKQTGEKKTSSAPVPAITGFDGSAGILLDQLRQQGDYVNSRQFPSMIKPQTVFEELSATNHIIDIRSGELFEAGHIEGAVNTGMDAVLNHFENEIVPFKFDKIIIVCNGGQRSGYVTQLLRLLGYGNVYSMRWGMSAWNTEFAANYWLKKVSSDYQDKIVKEVSPKPQSYSQPVLLSSSSTGEELLRERVAELLSLDPKTVFLSAANVFENLDEYFIINFERRDKYESGHIPGAIRYKPQGTLGIPSEMSTIPTGQPVLVYCGTGQNSAFAVAYLRLFGYDARSLAYGNNTFMYQKMLDERETLSWHPYTEDDSFDFPYIKGKK
jgi:rhodanese-related sulfurtransferase